MGTPALQSYRRVYTDSNGKPGSKVVDLAINSAYAAGETAFFAAPPRTELEQDAPKWGTSFEWFWSGGGA